MTYRLAILDRDGVINVDSGYTHKVEDFQFTTDAAEAITHLCQQGLTVVVATNQSGVARGYYGLEEVHVFHAHINEQLAKRGAKIDRFYICPYHEKGTVAEYTIENHPDRKPNPGMILKALSDYSIAPEHAFMVGDNVTDVQAAEAAGIKGVLHTEGSLLERIKAILTV